MSEEQKQLFSIEPADWEADDSLERLVATVVFLDGPPLEYDYGVPGPLRTKVEVGRRVQAPLGRGNRPRVGYCVRVETRATQRRLKDLESVVDERSLLSPSMLRLTQWIAEHYLCPWVQVLEAVVPAGVRAQAGTRVATLLAVPDEVKARLGTLELPRKQMQVLQYLAGASEPLTATQLAAATRATLAPITALRRKGLIASTSRRIRPRERKEPAVPRDAEHALNGDQQAALSAILSAMHSQQQETLLLHGITGSGKTEVYLRAVQEAIGFGRQAIVLVPEISLTPQAKQRFRARFGEVAVLHSHLSDGERHWHWQRIAKGEVSVVVGARSAVFAPAPHLGLIVLDEEHESSFKQDTAPRYHARDVALERARSQRVPLVLGSATPSLESWRRAQTGEFRLLRLPRRVHDRPLPEVVTVDLRMEQLSRGARGAISRPLKRAMDEALAAGGQVILLLNRRGFSTHLQCPACGQVVRCPECDIALTHHRHGEIALCHYCDYETPAPGECPSCHFTGIRYSGLGTQRLEAEVRANFSSFPCLRMDTDSMRGPASHERALEAFRAGDIRILLGTQMIAKGLDFPNVTLVGVVNADTALHLPDFRASERTCQLLVQVAGRTGRGDRGGKVYIQTLTPDHPAIVAAQRHDYVSFATQELPIRKELSYPPFGCMVRFVIRGKSQATTQAFATELAKRLTAALAATAGQSRVLGPAPAPFARLRGLFRYQVHGHAPDGKALRVAAESATGQLEPPENVQWIADVDPQDML